LALSFFKIQNAFCKNNTFGGKSSVVFYSEDSQSRRKETQSFFSKSVKIFESVAEILITKFRKKDGVMFTKLSSV